MKPAALQMLFQWFSPAYPVGSFSYSHGLEWAISQGDITDAATLAVWLRGILEHGTGRNDAIFLVAAYGAPPSGRAEIAELARAFNPSKGRLLETSAQGAAFAKTTRSIWPSDLPDMPYPVAVGVAARLHGLPLEETVALYLHSFIANLVSAAVRFMPLGQTEGQRVLAGLQDAVEQVAVQALGLGLEDLGGCAFRADMAAMAQETLGTRIFRT